jgi:hypothetical protein
MPAGFYPQQPLPAFSALPDDDSTLWWTVVAAGAGALTALAGLAWHAAANARDHDAIRREVQALAEAQAARDVAFQAQLDDLTAVSPFAASGLPSVRTLSRLAALSQRDAVPSPSRALTLRAALPDTLRAYGGR